MKKPYYRGREGAWYLMTDAGREVKLGPDEEAAYDTWQLMRERHSDLTPTVSYRRLAAAYLEANYEETPKFKQDATRIARFAKFLGPKPVPQITRKDMITWLNEKKPGQKKKDGTRSKITWAQSTKKDAFSQVMKVIRWGVRKGHIAQNPLSDVTIEDGDPREALMTPEQHKLLMEACDPHFRLYLQACACGPRPQQVREVTAKHVLPDVSAWVFTKHKTKKKTNKNLVVHLPPCLRTITTILMEKHPTGPLFRNSRGGEWKKDSVGQKFRRLRDKLGLPDDLVNYSYRHTFATDALMNDVPLATVAELLGHKDTRMVSRVYGHLDKHRKHLSEAAAKAKGG